MRKLYVEMNEDEYIKFKATFGKELSSYSSGDLAAALLVAMQRDGGIVTSSDGFRQESFARTSITAVRLKTQSSTITLTVEKDA